MSKLLSGSGAAGKDESETEPSRQQENRGCAMLVLIFRSSQKHMAWQKVQEAEKERSMCREGRGK